MRFILRSLSYGFLAMYAMLGLAQSPTGTISGTVQDQSGAAVRGASVVVVNGATKQTKTIYTDDAGRYSLPLVPPGVYTVTAMASGFEPTRQQGVVVQVSITRPIDFKLTPGSVSQQVTVSSTTPPLETNSSTVDAVITGREAVELPLNGRNPFSLETLVPGVSDIGNAIGNGSTPHISGSQNGTNELLIDGMTNILPENNVGNSTAAYQPIVDSVDEFSVQTSVPPAQYGRFSGGVINLVTKSGTNQLHGSAFAFVENAAFFAKNYFQQGPTPDQSQTQAGGTIGAPIVIPHAYNGHNKTFFFFAFEDSRQSVNQTDLESVPLASWRSGVFDGGSPVIYDPLTVRPSSDGYSRTPFPNNAIPAGRISPTGAAAMRYYPMPNIGGADAIYNNYTITGANTNDYDHFDFRLDTNWTPNWHTFGRLSHLSETYNAFNAYGNAAGPGGSPYISTAYSFSFDNAVTLSPKIVLDIRYGFSRSAAANYAYGQPFDLTSIGLPASYASIASRNASIFPTYSIGNGFSGLGGGGYVNYEENPYAHSVVVNMITNHRGNSITSGAEFRKLFSNTYTYGFPSGNFNISQSWTQQNLNNADGTGNPFASMLLGLADSGNITHDVATATAGAYLAAYIQDDYQASKTLTFNLGVRWDVEIPRTERHNQLSYWDPSLPSPLQGVISGDACPDCGNLRGQFVFAGAPNNPHGRRQAPTQWRDFAPRAGFSWAAAPKTVLRGGYGIVFQPSALAPAGESGTAGTDGFSGQTPFSFTFDNQRTIAATLDNPAPAGYDLPLGAAGGADTLLGQSNYGYFSSYRNPYGVQGNLNVQQALPYQTVIQVGYVYNHGLFLINGDPGVPFSQLDPSYLKLGNHLFDIVANPFYGHITTAGSDLSQPTVQQNRILAPFPQYSNVVSFRKPTAGSHYNSVYAQLEKRYSQGLYLLVSFTGSKTMDNASGIVSYLGPTSQTYANQYNPRAEFGLSAYDVSKQTVASFLYELPLGHRGRFLAHLPSLADHIISGWQVNGIVSFASGTPIVLSGADDQTGLRTLGQRPTEASGDANLRHKTLQEWFNTALFSQPAPFVIGNAPRTLPNVRNPGVANGDLSGFKNNYFGADDRYNVQFRLEAFNALNHPQFGGPDTGVNSGTFGVINSQANAPRQLQFAVKFIF